MTHHLTPRAIVLFMCATVIMSLTILLFPLSAPSKRHLDLDLVNRAMVEVCWETQQH